MRIRLFQLAAAAVLATASFVSAQGTVPATMPSTTAPAAMANAPAGMMPIPTAPAASAPIVVQAPAGCGTPALPCTTEASPVSAPCSTCGPTLASRVVSRASIGCGTANPVDCGTRATEKTFLFGGCNQFFKPCRTCGGSSIEYGSGGYGPHDTCKKVTSYTNR